MDAPEIILASGSPRRRELLGGLGVRFEVVTANVTELEADSVPPRTPAQLATENARLKARAVAKMRPGRWVLGADTVVALTQHVSNFAMGCDPAHSIRTRLFAKPSSLEEALEFLRALSGRTHEVITGCALLSPRGQEELFHEVSHVTFLELTDETIARYVEAVNVFDKAGGYALQQHGEWIIAGVEGSRANVVGLPTEKLEKFLRLHRLLQT
jgi:septum formation protein